MAPPVLTISTARQQFFDLFEAVTSRHGRKVIITSRGFPQHAVLVGETYLNDLETAAKRLRDIEAGHISPVGEFKLVGSGRIKAGMNDPVAEVREEATAAFEKKLRSFTKAKVL